MQVQLIVVNEQRKGQVIPINIPSFMIGRAEGCNLRSRSAHVSRYHCVISVSNEIVTVQDLGGGNGTFVNGQRIPNLQPLRNGDNLVVGTHSFNVSIQPGKNSPSTSHEEYFELSTAAPGQTKPDQGDTMPLNPGTVTEIIQDRKSAPQTDRVMFEIRLDGQRVSVTKSRLFELALKGVVSPDDLVTIAGTKVFADSIQGIVFGSHSSSIIAPSMGTVALPPPSPPATPAPPPSEAAPFEFPGLGNIADELGSFHAASEPFVRIARKESAFNAIWRALDISFSRVYTMEGNNLVIHSIKALYYVVVVVCLLFIFYGFLEFGIKWYENGDLLGALQSHFVLLSVSTLGCTLIIVIVRVLLEMLLLAWFESAKYEEEQRENK